MANKVPRLDFAGISPSSGKENDHKAIQVLHTENNVPYGSGLKHVTPGTDGKEELIFE